LQSVALSGHLLEQMAVETRGGAGVVMAYW
jgi:hypothetical protein